MKKTPLYGRRRRKSPVELLDNQIYFFGNVPSMKNGKQIGCKDRNGRALSRPTVRLNDDCKNFLIELAPQQVEQYARFQAIVQKWGIAKKDFKKIVLQYQFIRPSRRSVFDYSNAIEILQDALTGKVYIPQRGKIKRPTKYVDRVKNMPNLSKYLQWLPEDNNTRVVPAFNPEDLYHEHSPGVIITFFQNFSTYVDFLVEQKKAS